MQQPHRQILRWLRTIGDTVFAIGTLTLGWFVIGLSTGWRLKKERYDNLGLN